MTEMQVYQNLMWYTCVNLTCAHVQIKYVRASRAPLRATQF